MVTMVGKQKDFESAVESLLELDYAAIAAYKDAIDSLEDKNYKLKLKQFKEDHERHVKELSHFISQQGKTPPKGAGIKQLFTQGKVMFAQLIGDKAILSAMKSNEDDTNAAYENMNNHPEKPAAAAKILQRGLEDEKKHRAWIEKTIKELK